MCRTPLAGKRILHITEHFGPGMTPIGGANNVLRSVALESMHMGAFPVVIVDSLRKSAPHENHWVRDGLEVYKFPLLKSITKNVRKIGRTKIRQLFTKIKFLKVPKMFRPDIVYLTMYGGELRSAFEIKQRLGAKVVVSAQALDLHLLSRGRYDQVEYAPYWKESVEDVDAWVPCAPIVFERLLNWGIPEEKMVPIYNSVEVPDSLVTSRNDSKTKRQVKIAYAGRIIVQKGVLDLANAVVEFTKLEPEIRPNLQIIGGYTSEMLYALQSRLSVANGKLDYKLFGEVTSERVREIVSAADIFCHPSMFPHEGLPLSTLEAGAYGCPMILSEHPAHLSVYKPNVHALYCKTGDPGEFAFAIARLAREGDFRRKLRENAYELVKERFNHRRMLDEYMALYEKLLKSD